ncbi:hypothetical protein CAEBREN_09013 [Caenorhabditis brenneri]|uniref:RING-type domain-containing protein n=1 Tax=Caenorhabditis brenneri TaxID=135651 RepID=G0P921_CAEBE|nr:hypothetical protein CAEBREN_09013 [Caenorhabditis brenneri]
MAEEDAWLGRPAPRPALEIRRVAPVMLPHNDENRVVGWQDRQVPVVDPAEPGAVGPEDQEPEDQEPLFEQLEEPECWSWKRGGEEQEESLTATDDGESEDPLQERIAKLELELSHARHILYQTEEELHVTNEVLVAVQYENHQRRQQIERIRGPRVAHLPECPICTETFTLHLQATRPRILHCGHTVCHTCIQSMLEGTHRLHCPICRFKCMIISAEHLPVNWALF